MKKIQIPQRSYCDQPSFPLIEVSRRKRFVDGNATNTLDSVYTVLMKYAPTEIRVEDDGTALDSKDVTLRVEAGNPIQVSFDNCFIVITPKTQYELSVRGTADKMIVHNMSAKDAK